MHRSEHRVSRYQSLAVTDRNEMKRVLYYIAKMADASQSRAVKKTPDNLYDLCLSNVVTNLQDNKCNRDELQGIPDSILMDVYYKVSALLCSNYPSDNKNSGAAATLPL